MAVLADPEVRHRLAEGAASDGGGRAPRPGQLGRPAHRRDVRAPKPPARQGRAVGEVAAATRGGSVRHAARHRHRRRAAYRPAAGVPRDPKAWDRWRCGATPGRIVGRDAGAHLDMMCGAVYTTAMLAGRAPDRGIALEEAVQLLTDVRPGSTGSRSGAGSRPGGAPIWWCSTRRRSATGRSGPRGPPRRRLAAVADAQGITSVLVGVEACRDGIATGALPGTVLRSGRDTETVSARG